ncbi:hypothetical protein BCR37DRAFT_335540, partial [Protomyces lactucae-debilis]
PSAEITPETFKKETRNLDVQGSSLLLEVQFLSNDPAQRPSIQAGLDPKRAYMPPPNQGDIMPARALCKVVCPGPTATRFKAGDRVVAPAGWTHYAVVDESACQPATILPGLSETACLGLLGGTGLTAYYGLLKVGEAETKKPQCIVVSGSAGATGSVVVQIAKHVLQTPKVIGLAGGPDKCAAVKALGADICIDYKSADWKQQLAEATDAACELYFDNVGGETLDCMLPLMKRHGTIVACGAISSYESMGNGVVLKNYFEIISNRLRIQGFIVIDALKDAASIIGELATWIKEGKIKAGEGSETVVEATLDEIPQVWQKLFTGGNKGKLVT